MTQDTGSRCHILSQLHTYIIILFLHSDATFLWFTGRYLLDGKGFKRHHSPSLFLMAESVAFSAILSSFFPLISFYIQHVPLFASLAFGVSSQDES